jgi:hypothetical protein
MLDLVPIGVASGFVVVGIAGVIYGTKDFILFKGDIMERFFKFMASGFLLVTLISSADAAMLAAGRTVPTVDLALALMAPAVVFLIGLMSLVNWNERSKIDQTA